jgi:glutamyl-tRNA reductase
MRNMNGTQLESLSEFESSTLVLFSVSHHYAPVEIREKLAFDEDQRSALLDELGEFASEAVSITTCNRTEIYLVANADERLVPQITRIIASHGGVDAAELYHASQCQSDEDAARHLFRVASGLDSVILGEPQILGQVRDAMLEARERGTSGPILERLFQRALSTGKRARARTGISRGAGSISHAAVKLARDTVGELSDKRALTVGLGEMGWLVAKNLRANGVRSVEICNRTLDRAQEAADEIGGQAIPWDELNSAVQEADIVITATGAEDYVLTRSHLAPTNGHVPKQTLVIDISVPRNVDPQVDTLPHVQLFDIDALQAVQTEGMQSRQREIPKVEALIGEELVEFTHWLRGRQLAPTIQSLYQHACTIKESELEKALGRLSHLSPRDQEVIRALAHGITQKLLHTPVTRMKSTDQPQQPARAIGELFDLAPSPDEQS